MNSLFYWLHAQISPQAISPYNIFILKFSCSAVSSIHFYLYLGMWISDHPKNVLEHNRAGFKYSRRPNISSRSHNRALQTNKHINTMGLNDSGLRNKCGVVETVTQFDTACPAYSSFRYQTLGSFLLSPGDLRAVLLIYSNLKINILQNINIWAETDICCDAQRCF